MLQLVHSRAQKQTKRVSDDKNKIKKEKFFFKVRLVMMRLEEEMFSLKFVNPHQNSKIKQSSIQYVYRTLI